MGNAVGDPEVAMKQNGFDFTKIQAHLISDALSEYSGFEGDIEQEVTQRTERLIREKFNL